MLSPEDDALSILSFAESAWDEGERKKFAVLETKGGIYVVEVGRFFEALHENEDRNSRGLQEAIEHMNAKQSTLLATMELKQNLTSGASDEIQRKFLHDILVVEEKERC